MRELHYKKKGLEYKPINFWKTDENTFVAIYQGDRGQNPALDFILKYKENKKRLRTPSHTHWIVDLLIKGESKKSHLINYINELINIYDESIPFKSHQERENYSLIYPQIMGEKYKELSSFGYYSIETLTSFIELFSKCEKQSTGAFMFRGLLTLVKEYCEGKKDFYQIVGYSKRV